jgi:hypothetical protein
MSASLGCGCPRASGGAAHVLRGLEGHVAQPRGAPSADCERCDASWQHPYDLDSCGRVSEVLGVRTKCPLWQ